jgi:hypothetical protein
VSSRDQINVRPGAGVRAIAIAFAGGAAIALVVATFGGGANAWIAALALALGAYVAGWPKSFSHNDSFVIRSAVRTRTIRRSDIERVDLALGRIGGRKHLVLVTRDGKRVPVAGSSRARHPIPHWYTRQVDLSAEDLLTRMFLWRSVGSGR